MTDSNSSLSCEAEAQDIPVKYAYENGECPDCGEDIPETVFAGEACINCEHVFWN